IYRIEHGPNVALANIGRANFYKLRIGGTFICAWHGSMPFTIWPPVYDLRRNADESSDMLVEELLQVVGVARDCVSADKKRHLISGAENDVFTVERRYLRRS